MTSVIIVWILIAIALGAWFINTNSKNDKKIEKFKKETQDLYDSFVQKAVRATTADEMHQLIKEIDIEENKLLAKRFVTEYYSFSRTKFFLIGRISQLCGHYEVPKEVENVG